NASNVFNKKLNIRLFHQISESCTTESLLEQTELIDQLSKIINYYYSMKYEFSSELKERWDVTNSDALITELETLLLQIPEKEGKINEREVQKLLIRHLSEQTGIHYNSLFSRLSVARRWNLLTHRKKDSNRYAARQLPLKFSVLKKIGCEPLNRENITRFYTRLAPMEHKRWSAEKMVLN